VPILLHVGFLSKPNKNRTKLLSGIHSQSVIAIISSAAQRLLCNGTARKSDPSSINPQAVRLREAPYH
jgi:hypothetical protein